jgi:hypothetical protein
MQTFKYVPSITKVTQARDAGEEKLVTIDALFQRPLHSHISLFIQALIDPSGDLRKFMRI